MQPRRCSGMRPGDGTRGKCHRSCPRSSHFACYFQLPNALGVSPISIWVQIPLYSLPALAEIFVNVTSYEIAYTRAPQRMKGVIFAIVLFMSAVSYAITLAISPSFVDPNLIWPFVGLAEGLVICAILIWIFFRKMDEEEAAVLAIGSTRKIEGIRGLKSDSEKS